MKWWRRVGRYLQSDTWVLVPFQPILYLFMWGAAVRLWFDDQSEPPGFDVIAPEFYHVWLALSVGSPLLTLLAWWMIQKCSGRVSFLGLWFRLAADIGMFTAVVTIHIALAYTQAPAIYEEGRIWSRYLSGAVIVFLIGLLIRDVWVLAITERLAWRIHRGDCGPNGDECE